MKIKQKIVALALMAGLTTGVGMMAATPAFADCGGAKTSIINCDQKAGAKKCRGYGRMGPVAARP